jgi:hypothetical protein
MDKIVYSEKDILAFERLAKQGPLGKRALYIYQYLFLTKGFKDFVIKVRHDLDIPMDGFDGHNENDQLEIMDKRRYISAPFYNGELLRMTMTKS